MKLFVVLALGFLTVSCATIKPEPASTPQQYADSFRLTGRPSADAYVAFTQAGFNCRLVSGIVEGIPRAEPVMYCATSDTKNLGCKDGLRMIGRLEWAGEQPNPFSAGSKNIAEVVGACAPRQAH